MARQLRIKTRKEGSKTEILAMIDHPMETGRRKNKKTGETIPAHYVEKMNFELNGKLVASANLGPPVSKNAMVGISVKGAKSGDEIKVSWRDNKKESGSEASSVF